MLLQDDTGDFIESSLGGLYLPDDIDAISFFIKHALDAADVTFHVFQTVDCIFVLHQVTCSLVINHPYTPPRGVGYKDFTTEAISVKERFRVTLHQCPTPLHRLSGSLQCIIERLSELLFADHAQPFLQHIPFFVKQEDVGLYSIA